jgi:hypothetical protein
MRLQQHLGEQIAEQLAGPIPIGVRHCRALHRCSTHMIKPHLVALQPGDDVPQARRTAELTEQQRQKLPLRRQLARQFVGAVVLNKPLEPSPRHVFG